MAPGLRRPPCRPRAVISRHPAISFPRAPATRRVPGPHAQRSNNDRGRPAPMGATRPKPKAHGGMLQFPLERARGRLALALDQGELASEVSRGLAELAAAHGSPLVVVASHGRLASALRSARLLGMEPRVLAPAGEPGLPARLTLSLALRGTAGPAARASAVAYLAAYAAAGGAGATGTSAGGPLAAAIARKVTQLGVRFTFELLAAELSRVPTVAQAPGLPAALAALHEAEVQASVFSTPVPWSRVLAPSPRGRPAAVWVDLSSLGEDAAPRVGGLALASLAATVAEWSPTLEGRPPVLLAQGVEGPVGAFALERLLGPAPPAPLFGLLVEPAGGSGKGWALPGVASALLARGELSFEGVDAPLPLPDASGEALALTASERAALTPLTLRERMLGGIHGDEGDVAGEGEEPPGPPAAAASARDRASSEALQQAIGDLDKITRGGIRPGKRRGAGRGARSDYEAADFDVAERAP